VMPGLDAHTASVGSSLRRGWPTGALIAVLLAAVPIASAVAIAGVPHALQIGTMALSAGATSLAPRWPRGSRPARSAAVAPADTPAALLPVDKPRSQP
jgi:hypothetical protein